MAFSKKIGIFFALLLFLLFMFVIDLDPSKPLISQTAAVAVLMAVLWMTEAIPLAATSLIPLVLFPFLGVVSGSDIAASYINSVIFLFLGGFLIAIAMENWNLHKRIALKVISIFGGTSNAILIGFMLASAFLSMWISNTATAVMMLPIALSVISKMEEKFGRDKAQNFSKLILLGIAYSCSIGGMSTLVGTPPNLALIRINNIIFPDAPQISFGPWMLLALPIAAIVLLLALFVIKRMFRIDKEMKIDKSFIREEYKSLGKISREEKVVQIIFCITVFLWIFRTDIDFGFFKLIGWASLLNTPDFIDDGTVAITTALILFFIPSKKNSEQERILIASSFEQVPWGIILLFGGGFALAQAFADSGLSQFIGAQLKGITHINIFILILIISAMINFLTELTSNTATTQMILPVLASVAVAIEVNPLLLMIPATLSASMAFMLPVGTPPNTIIFASKRIEIKDMVKTGFLLNISSIIIITLLVYFLGSVIFDLQVFPDWAIIK